MDAIEISAYDTTGKIQVVRIISNVASQRMILGADRQRRKIDFEWQRKAIELLNQPSAEVTIEVSSVPVIEMSKLERLEAIEQILAEHVRDKDVYEPKLSSDEITSQHPNPGFLLYKHLTDILGTISPIDHKNFLEGSWEGGTVDPLYRIDEEERLP